MERFENNALENWHLAIAAMEERKNEDDTLALLAEGCRQLVPADVAFAAVFGKGIRPVSVYEDVPEKNRRVTVDSYFDAAYLLDPFYRGGINGMEEGLYRLMDLGPRGFKESEFYKRYYYQSGWTDEVGYLTYLHDGCFMNFGFARTNGSKNFRKSDIEALSVVQPVVHVLLRRFWKDQSQKYRTAPSELHTQLQAALSHFGNSVLTVREAEVTRMYFRGHNTASISERLGISRHTVSAHRKSVYLKLDVSSQAELFALFIGSLTCFDPAQQRDPLQDYLGFPGRIPSDTDEA